MSDQIAKALFNTGGPLGTAISVYTIGKKLLGGLFDGSDAIPYTPQQLAAMSLDQIEQDANSPNLYGDGDNEGLLETIGPSFEDTVRLIQSLEDGEEKAKLLEQAARIIPYDFTDITASDIMPDMDLLANTTDDTNEIDTGTDVLASTTVASPAATQNIEVVPNSGNTGTYVGPKPIQDLSPEEIMEVYKDRKIKDLIRDFPSDDKGSQFPYEIVKGILIEAAKNNNKNAEQILINSGFPIAGTDGAIDGDGSAVGTGDAVGDAVGDAAINNQAAYEGAAANNQAGAKEAANRIGDGNTDTDLKADNATVGAGTVDTGTGGTPTGTPTGNTGTDDTGTSNPCGAGFRYDPNSDSCVPIVNIGGLEPLTAKDEPKVEPLSPNINILAQSAPVRPSVQQITTPISDTLFQTEIYGVPVTRGTLLDRTLGYNLGQNWRNRA